MSKKPFRILHTADWHLGREFHGHDLTRLHEAFFDWLVEQITEREIDLVLMAGDIYDRALPPVDAIQLFNDQVTRMTGLTEVVLITGNHDSVVRMSHGSLLRENLHLRSGLEGLGRPVIVEKDFRLAIYPIPYLDPVTMASELDLDESTHTAVLTEAAGRCRSDLAASKAERSIAIGHAFITGSEASESERSIQVGGSESVAGSIFEGFDYVALGHLHRPQQVGERIRYSGSPIPLSFSEVGGGAPKSVTVLELSADGGLEIETVEIPQVVQMARISGTLDELLHEERTDLDELRDHWLEVTLTDDTRPLLPMEKLRTRFENVVSLRFTASIGDADGGEGIDLEKIPELEPLELVDTFIKEMRGTPMSEAETALVTEALDARTGEETVS